MNQASANIDPSGAIGWRFYFPRYPTLQQPVVTMIVRVSFDFVPGPEGETWSKTRMDTFEEQYKRVIEWTWNRDYEVRPYIWGLNDYAIRSADFARVGFFWKPELEIQVVKKGADYRMQVKALPSGYHRSSARIDAPIGTGEIVAWLDEQDVSWRSTGVFTAQYPAAHELGHTLGLKHPGDYDPNYKGNPYHADSFSLMGDGVRLRTHYFKRWVDVLDSEYPRKGPYQAVWVIPRPLGGGALTETKRHPGEEYY